MVARVSALLRRSALVHRISRRLYWAVMGLIARWIGTPYFERKWRGRRVPETHEDPWRVVHPHRQWLMEQFDALYPFSSVLEIGCGFGPNLGLLAKRFPAVRATGIDISSFFVQKGIARLAELGIENVQLIVGKADDLSAFADGSVEIVFTDGTLLYIAPDKIQRVISEMKRISSRALLFVELHRSDPRRDPTGLGVFTPDGWVRDYRKLLNHFFSDDSITLRKIPADVWPEGRWKDYGYLIAVLL